MPQVFGHKYRLYVGNPSQLVELHRVPTGMEGQIPPTIKRPSSDPVSVLTGGYIDYATVPNNVRLIENPIQMEARIRQVTGKTNGSTPNAEIKLYNLSSATLNDITANSAVVLQAGYDTDAEIPTIFVGQVETVQTNRVGPDNVTILVCKDAANPLKTVVFNRSFPTNQTYNFILLQVIQTFQQNGVPLGRFQENDRSIQSITEQAVFNGKIGTVLTQICDEIDFVWFISKGRLYVQPRDEDRPTDFVLINPSNVIGSIRLNDDKSALPTNDKESRPAGIKVDTFLNGEVGLNTYVRVQEGDFQGDYKPEAVVHRLNWYSGPWQTSIETQRVKEFDLNTI